MFELEPKSYLVDVLLSGRGVQADRLTQFGQRGPRLGAPPRHVQPLTCPAEGEVMADDPEREVIEEGIRPRDGDEDEGHQEAQGIENEPELVLVEVTGQLLPQHAD